MTSASQSTRSLILGTSSKHRHNLFTQHFPDLPFTTLSPNLDEKAITAGYTDRSSAEPTTLTLALARAKAAALFPSLAPNSLLLTSDQVVSYNGTIREKPETPDICRQYLKSYATHPVVTVTAIVLTDSESGKSVEGVDVAEQSLKLVPDSIIDQLIAKGDVLHCAGGITVEDPLLAPYLAHRKGDLESIMGLPVHLVRQLLTRI